MSKVVVVGGGNAALCAAISARESGAQVLLLERAPKELRGGNSRFTAGLMRTAFNGAEDILNLIDSADSLDLENTEFGSYTEREFFDTLSRITEYRTDPELADTLVTQSYGTLVWLREHGVKFAPSFGRQAFKHRSKFRFFGGAVLEVVGGGPGLVDSLFKEAEALGVVIRYDARAVRLVKDAASHGRITGVVVDVAGTAEVVDTEAVVLAAGGFQSNVEWRARYLGPGWDLAKVRGTRFNTGDGISMALEAGAAPAGNWTGCHAVAWDRNAPEFGDLAVGDGFQKHSYPFGLIVNQAGKRFVDEGADFRNYTYAKYGQEVLKQPGQTAWQVFDSQTTHLLRDEYRIREVTKVTATTLEELAAKMDGVDSEAFLATVAEFNAAVDRSVDFNPNILDGRRTRGLTVEKTNWALPIEQGPFEAYQVTCGITFTFGGIQADVDARAIDGSGRGMPNLFVCGEMLGGLFYLNYPGGSGLTAGSVFGRIAGRNAAATASLHSIGPAVHHVQEAV